MQRWRMGLRARFPEVGFGTSGLRALVRDLTPEAVGSYARAFARTVAAGAPACLVGWDLRPSSPRIAAVVAAGLAYEGVKPIIAGPVPTPALAFAGFTRGLPSVMVTGSHIPFDRNGVKFYRADGEIDKADEARLVATWLPVESLPMSRLGPFDSGVMAAYVARYRALLPAGALRGMRVGVYQHSGVARDVLVTLLQGFGAEVIALGRSDVFVPIDTEAFAPEDVARARLWCRAHALQALVSTDGDADRPWLADERGHFVPGDVLGPWVGKWLGVKRMVAPLNVNSVLEQSGWFEEVVRTRIGSPFVLAGMAGLSGAVAGYEGNGGFLLGSPLRGLAPLPTRDALLPLLVYLRLAREQGVPVSALRAQLPARFTASGRLQGVEWERLTELLVALPGSWLVGCEGVDRRDGVRMLRAGGEVVHLRVSGNAPELRVYVEAGSEKRATALRDRWLARVARRIGGGTRR
jgi:phosphomannomutase